MEPNGPSTRGESRSARIVARESPLVEVRTPVHGATHAIDHRVEVALVGCYESQAVLSRPESDCLMSTSIAGEHLHVADAAREYGGWLINRGSACLWASGSCSRG
jgi:hypothetical protein